MRVVLAGLPCCHRRRRLDRVGQDVQHLREPRRELVLHREGQEDEFIAIGGGEVGPMAKKYYKAITDIQYGKAEDQMGWIVPVA